MITGNNRHWVAIQEFYGDTQAERTGVPYINHIKEGLYILTELGATQEAKEAYCIHPIYQTLKRPEEHEIIQKYSHAFNSHSVELAKEYARVANAYLCKIHFKSAADKITLSESPEVNDMLIADNVQKRKDYECNYENQPDKEDFERSAVLSQYFKNWIKALGLTEEEYAEYKDLLIVQGL